MDYENTHMVWSLTMHNPCNYQLWHFQKYFTFYLEIISVDSSGSVISGFQLDNQLTHYHQWCHQKLLLRRLLTKTRTCLKRLQQPRHFLIQQNLSPREAKGFVQRRHHQHSQRMIQEHLEQLILDTALTGLLWWSVLVMNLTAVFWLGFWMFCVYLHFAARWGILRILWMGIYCFKWEGLLVNMSFAIKAVKTKFQIKWLNNWLRNSHKDCQTRKREKNLVYI